MDQVSQVSDGDGRNTNWTILTYGGNSFTGFKSATVTVYQFDIVKTRDAGSGVSKFNLLKDAEFVLYEVKSETEGTYYEYGTGVQKYLGNAITFDKSADGKTYTYTGTHATTGTTIVSLPQDEVNLRGLDAGEYLLLETKEPTGFNKLAYPIWITINGGDDAGSTSLSPAESSINIVTKNNNNKVSDSTNKNWDATVTKQGSDTEKTYTETANGGINIVNYTAQELPSTGGMGTTVLYIVGGMLVILAGAYLFFSKKKTA